MCAWLAYQGLMALSRNCDSKVKNMTRSLLQPITNEVIDQVRSLVRTARHAALAVLEMKTGHPAVSRVTIATTDAFTPILLTSALAPHTAALQADGRCSLLIGEVGKGDLMAHPRITLFCTATTLERTSHPAMRDRFLAHHPKARNYIDLPDFGFWQLDVVRVSYNAGFGKAYGLTGVQFLDH